LITLFNQLGDRLLRAVLPQADAGATVCWSHPDCSKCFGTYCVNYTPCEPDGSTVPGYPHWCWISGTGGSGMSYSPCPC
jgi:hypothetical protein